MFKKILLAAVLAVSASFAQISFGAHVGANMSTMWGDDAEDITSGVGFSAGVAAKISLPLLPITLAPEVLIDMRNTGVDGSDDYSMTEWALEIPVLVRLSILPILYVEAGPTFAFNLSSSEEDEIMGKEVSNDIDSDLLNTFEFGLAFGVGTGIVPFLDIDFRVNLGLTNFMAEQKFMGESIEVDASNLQFVVGATYWF